MVREIPVLGTLIRPYGTKESRLSLNTWLNGLLSGLHLSPCDNMSACVLPRRHAQRHPQIFAGRVQSWATGCGPPVNLDRLGSAEAGLKPFRLNSDAPND